MVGCMFGGGSLQGCYVGGLEQLGEDIGVWGGGSLVDKVGGGVGRAC